METQLVYLCAFLIFCPMLHIISADKEWEVAFDTDYIARFSVNDTAVKVFVTASWTGWVGFAISPKGIMDGADIFLAGVFPNGTTYNGDYYGVAHSIRSDAESNWEFLGASENGTHTTVGFSRLFDTGDVEHDNVIEEGSIIVLWAFGVTDTLAYHTGARGAADIVIREEQWTSDSTPDYSTGPTPDVTQSSKPDPTTDYSTGPTPVVTQSSKTDPASPTTDMTTVSSGYHSSTEPKFESTTWGNSGSFRILMSSWSIAIITVLISCISQLLQ